MTQHSLESYWVVHSLQLTWEQSDSNIVSNANILGAATPIFRCVCDTWPTVLGSYSVTCFLFWSTFIKDPVSPGNDGQILSITLTCGWKVELMNASEFFGLLENQSPAHLTRLCHVNTRLDEHARLLQLYYQEFYSGLIPSHPFSWCSSLAGQVAQLGSISEAFPWTLSGKGKAEFPYAHASTVSTPPWGRGDTWTGPVCDYALSCASFSRKVVFEQPWIDIN